MGVRLTYIGGTVAAAVMGVSEWSNPAAELYLALGRYAGLIEPPDLTHNRDVMRGVAMEPLIVDLIRSELDPSCRPYNELVYHPEIPAAGGHPDAIGDEWVYEIKAPREPAPLKPEYFWQAVHYAGILWRLGMLPKPAARVVQLNYTDWRLAVSEFDDLTDKVEELESRLKPFCEVFQRGKELIDAGQIKTLEQIFEYVKGSIDVPPETEFVSPDVSEMMDRAARLRAVRRAVDNEIRAINNVIKPYQYGKRVSTKAYGRTFVI